MVIMADPANFESVARGLGIPKILIEAAELDDVLDDLVRTHADGLRLKLFCDDEENYAGQVPAC